ncbi:hypothetical protein EW026_g2590 [Hermanssonia centrifuga]|uniref:Fanconi-associated nuclease n=1 Tax=Hermanssonia centrifuga TaxID=98765 RepID=A0A4S4KMU2_9APHY|nr:hypothetical protein EW026_g2590 [Hermanssonia centrifuga]
MVLGSPTSGHTGELVFRVNSEGDVDHNGEKVDEHIDHASEVRGKSMYVQLFEEMLQAVFEGEAYLFTQEELRCLIKYSDLSYDAQYLLIRLSLRKSDQWLRLSDLKYQAELGSRIPDAIKELCIHLNPVLVSEGIKVKVEERDGLIDLTFDEQDVPPIVGHAEQDDKPAFLSLHSAEAPDYSYFAEDASHAPLRELLECLKREELREIVNQLKLKPRASTKDAFVDVLISQTATQATLPFLLVAVGASTAKRGRPTQQDRLREIVMKKLAACVKLNLYVLQLFRRVNMVYFRSTQYSSKLLTEAILARARRRTYASCDHKRTPNIWPNRRALIDYEEALELESQVDSFFNQNGSNVGARARSRSATSRTPGPAPLRTGLSESPRKRRRGGIDDGLLVKCEEVGDSSNIKQETEEVPESARVQDARQVKAIFETVYPRWQQLVAAEGEGDGRTKGLERFHHGYVLTRIVCKGTHALGILKEHEAELGVLEALLRQTRWRRGRRGRWYERRALILMTHLSKEEGVYHRAMTAVLDALKDSDTHIIFRPKLLRRLTSLEKKLRIPEGDRHVCATKLEKADEVYIEGVRLHVTFNGLGKVVEPDKESGVKKENKQIVLSFIQLPDNTKESDMKMKPGGKIVNAPGKSIWRGRDKEEVSVEIFALQHYEDKDFKGFHCEGRIVTTLFGLLFWDIIFASIPGAFETPYQVAPLDIAEETFYFSRQALAEARFVEIRNGDAPQLLAKTFDEYASDATCCVGVRWDLFEKQDLVEIAECLGGLGLAVICQLLCEDYAGRTSGVPDLIVWNKASGECKFVEVKGPGDSLQENQKVWIDVLLQAGIQVEICHVAEEGKTKTKKNTKTQAKKDLAQKKRKRAESDVELEEEEVEVDYSQLDVTNELAEAVTIPVTAPVYPSQLSPPATPSKSRRMVPEVVITSPSRQRSPRKKTLSERYMLCSFALFTRAGRALA